MAALVIGAFRIKINTLTIALGLLGAYLAMVQEASATLLGHWETA